jgi:hypothetical protein
MDGLKQIEVGVVNAQGVQTVIGLRGDGVLFHGQVVHGAGGPGKIKVAWTSMEEELRK